MPASYRTSGRQSNPENWRDELATIKAARQELRQYSGMMTKYERSVIERDIDSMLENYRPRIAAGAIGEYKVVLAKFQDARRGYDRELTKEINRWDAIRLRAELETSQQLIDLAIQRNGGGPFDGNTPSVSTQLEAIFNQAQRSGDIHRQRAAYEVIQAVTAKISGEERFPVNRLAKLAERELEALRFTDGMKEAQENISRAWDEFLQTRQEVIDAGKELGDDPTAPLAGGEFTRAIRMVKQDLKTGEVTVLPEDHPDVTGVIIREPTIPE